MIYGSGSAGLGIARQLRDAIALDSSASPSEAAKQFWLIDKHGLIKKSLGKDKIRSEIEDEFIRNESDWGEGETGLKEVVKKVKPTVLVGTSTQAGAFTEEVVRVLNYLSQSLRLTGYRLKKCLNMWIGLSSSRSVIPPDFVKLSQSPYPHEVHM